MADPNWFYSTLAQSSAAIVGLAGGFMVSRVLAQRNDLALDRQATRNRMLDLHRATVTAQEIAARVQQSISSGRVAAENAGQLDASQIETFTHPGNHGQQGSYATDVHTLGLLQRIADDASDYEQALGKLARDPKTLSDMARTGKDAEHLAAEWLNEDLEGIVGGGGNLYQSLGQQRDWMRNDWQARCISYNSLKGQITTLRTRAAVASLGGLVAVLGAFLVFGVLVPLAYLSARAGASRGLLLAAFGVLAVLFFAYLGNEVRRLANALHLEREFLVTRGMAVHLGH
jgi:hypothetical protein